MAAALQPTSIASLPPGTIMPGSHQVAAAAAAAAAALSRPAMFTPLQPPVSCSSPSSIKSIFRNFSCHYAIDPIYRLKLKLFDQLYSKQPCQFQSVAHPGMANTTRLTFATPATRPTAVLLFPRVTFELTYDYCAYLSPKKTR